MEASADFVQGLREYRWLLDRGYSGTAARKLVGDRRRLSAEERIVLFRGVARGEESERRRARLGRPPPGGSLLLDAYNAGFTLVHYLIGKPCFLSSDGLLRDAGANYGRLPHGELLARAFAELAAYLAGLRLGRLEAWLDAPVSRSAAHAAELRAALASAGMGEARVELAASADGAILERLRQLGAGPAAEEGEAAYVASSDSVLAERSPRVFDLARAVLESRYSASFLDLGSLLEEEGRGAGV